METAIVSLICIALILFGGMTMAQGFLTSMDSTVAGLESASNRIDEIMKTELSTVNTTQPAANRLQVTVENSGQTKLASFSKWDVIVQYYDSGGTYHIKWLPYTDNGSLGDNEWKVQWIQLNGDTEVLELNILNPGEEMRIEAKLNPSVGDNTTNLVVVSTPNGVTASISFPP